MIGVVGELDSFSSHIYLWEPDKSEDKAEGETSVESSIPCSHGRRTLVVKGAEEVENAEANSKRLPPMLGTVWAAYLRRRSYHLAQRRWAALCGRLLVHATAVCTGRRAGRLPTLAVVRTACLVALHKQSVVGSLPVDRLAKPAAMSSGGRRAGG
ncbi:hypothetical protein GW17_00026622 [Ensete ventricosum]|nr:hypothetical protein GW17_00026622 [Ensete ventricosum]